MDVTALQVDDPLMEAAHGQEQPVTPPCSEFGDLDLNELDDFDAPLREAAAQGQDDFGDDIPDLDAPLRVAAAALDRPAGGDGGPPGDGDVPTAQGRAGRASDSVNAFLDLWDSSVAPTVGDRARRVTQTQQASRTVKLAKRKGLSHPDTRTVENAGRLAMLKQPPGQDDQQGSGTFAFAQALTRETAERHLIKEIRHIWDGVQDHGRTPSGTKWITLGKSGDETCFAVRLSEKECAIWVEWLLRKLRANRYLEDDDIQKCSRVLKARQVGLVHLLGQGVSIRWDEGSTQSSVRDVPVVACGVQRTSASNYLQATEKHPDEVLSFQYFKDCVAPFLAFSYVVMGSDEGSGPVRSAKDVCEMYRDVENVSVLSLNCKGHVVGNASGEAMELEGSLTFLVRWSKLLRQFETYNTWLAGQAVDAARKIGSNILPAAPGDFSAEKSNSDQFWDRLAECTVYRDTVTQSITHPLEPSELLTAEAQDAFKQRLDRAKGLVTECKLLVQHIPRNLEAAQHICFGPSTCGQYCTKGSWSVRFDKVYSEILTLLTPHGVQVAKTRFLSWMKLLALAMFTIMVACLGVGGWLEEWSIPRVNKDFTNNANVEAKDDSDQFKKDQTVRFHGCSHFLSTLGNRIFLCVANVGLMASDQLFRFMDRADSTANRGKYKPLILQVVQTDPALNPLNVFYKERTEALMPEGNVTWVLDTFLTMPTKGSARISGEKVSRRCGSALKNIAKSSLNLVWLSPRLAPFSYSKWRRNRFIMERHLCRHYCQAGDSIGHPIAAWILHALVRSWVPRSAAPTQ